jgi:hypothetical protein
MTFNAKNLHSMPVRCIPYELNGPIKELQVHTHLAPPIKGVHLSTYVILSGAQPLVPRSKPCVSDNRMDSHSLYSNPQLGTLRVDCC